MRKFAPFVQITRTDDDRIAVMFDSACDADATRTPRVVFIRRDMESLSWQVLEEGGEGGKVLRVDLSTGVGEDAIRYFLGTISGDFTVNSVRQAFSDAFQSALAAYLQNSQRLGAVAGMSSDTSPRDEAYAYGYAHVPPPQPIAKPAGRTFLKSVGAVAAIGVLGFAGVYGFSSWIASTPYALSAGRMDPIQAAVAQNMAQDPASITAQVELTKETLRQMGLDPGRAGDLGCLAPQ